MMKVRRKRLTSGWFLHMTSFTKVDPYEKDALWSEATAEDAMLVI